MTETGVRLFFAACLLFALLTAIYNIWLCLAELVLILLLYLFFQTGISRRKKYYEYLPYIMVSAVLTKKDQSDWSEEELFPIEEIRYTDETGCGGFGPVVLQMKDGRCVTVDFEGMEGRLSI